MANIKCGICLVFTSLKEGDYFVNTQCGHIFHFECVRDWICQNSKNSTCPMCRSDISTKSVVKLHGISPAEIHTSRKLLNFKFVIIGDSGVGKTCLLHQYAKGVFIENQDATIGCDLYFKNVEVSGKIITLSIWDCGGQERFGAITPNYIRNAKGIFVVYDISNSESVNQISKWMDLIDKYAPPEVAIMLLGNKSDLVENRRVSKERGEGLAEQLSINFLETSAKEAYNVEAAFRTLTAQILEGMYRAGVTDELLQSSYGSNLSVNFSSSARCGC